MSTSPQQQMMTQAAMMGNGMGLGAGAGGVGAGVVGGGGGEVAAVAATPPKPGADGMAEGKKNWIKLCNGAGLKTDADRDEFDVWRRSRTLADIAEFLRIRKGTDASSSSGGDAGSDGGGDSDKKNDQMQGMLQQLLAAQNKKDGGAKAKQKGVMKAAPKAKSAAANTATTTLEKLFNCKLKNVAQDDVVDTVLKAGSCTVSQMKNVAKTYNMGAYKEAKVTTNKRLFLKALIKKLE